MATLQKTTRFKHYATLECGNGLYVDIITVDHNTKEAYLFNEQYGVKSLMFGIADGTYGDFIEMIASNVDEYIDDYRQEYMDEE